MSFKFLRPDEKRDLNGRRPGQVGYDKTTIQVRLAKDERMTPGQEQYWAIKKHHNDCVICFKMGKFYELFEEDALLGHRELDLRVLHAEVVQLGHDRLAERRAGLLAGAEQLLAERDDLVRPRAQRRRSSPRARGGERAATLRGRR